MGKNEPTPAAAPLAVPVPSKALDGAIAPPSSASSNDDLSYIVDMEVKESKLFLATWTTRQIALTTQTLE
ncbi:hypothetical protein SPRG_16327, partial [Saprolegnia parasitica CBS 223.65]